MLARHRHNKIRQPKRPSKREISVETIRRYARTPDIMAKELAEKCEIAVPTAAAYIAHANRTIKKSGKAKPNMNPVELHSEFNKKLDLGPPKTREEEERIALLKEIEEIKMKSAEAIEEAKVPTEKQMREEKVPTLHSLSELSTYIEKLVDRPHDYGTCAYAMSMAAVAAFNFVASKLSVTGFQASCADLDILCRTRGFKWGKIINYEDLLYPQYCNDDHFPSWEHLLNDPEVISELAKRAKVLLENKNKYEVTADRSVRKHWRDIVARDIYIGFGGKTEDAKKA